jgi:hypothetical protein
MWQLVDLEIYHQPFFEVQFVERRRPHPQREFDNAGAQVIMQIDDEIEFLVAKIPDQLAKVILQVMNFVNIWV